MKPRSSGHLSGHHHGRSQPPEPRLEEHPHQLFKFIFPVLAVYMHDRPSRNDRAGLGRLGLACCLGPCYTMLCWQPKKGGRSGWTDNDPPTIVCTIASIIFAVFFFAGILFFVCHMHSPSSGLQPRPMFGLGFNPFMSYNMDKTSNRMAEEHKSIGGGTQQGLMPALKDQGGKHYRYAGYGGSGGYSFLDKKRILGTLGKVGAGFSGEPGKAPGSGGHRPVLGFVPDKVRPASEFSELSAVASAGKPVFAEASSAKPVSTAAAELPDASAPPRRLATQDAKQKRKASSKLAVSFQPQ